MSKKYTVYDPDTGEIRLRMSLSGDGQCAEEHYIEGDFDPKEYIIVNGQAQRKPDSVLEQQAIDKAWADLKMVRDGRLKGSDWTQVPDAPVDAAAWAVYRQQLRDLPANTTDPRNVVWPEPPS
jgi:hypothetical protein